MYIPPVPNRTLKSENIWLTWFRKIQTLGVGGINSGTALVGFLQTGLNAVTRTLSSKLNEWISVTDFGADNTGVQDSTAAFINAMAAGKNIHIPEGTYLVNVDLTAKRGYWFRGSGRDNTTLKNFNSNPVFNLVATGADCKFNKFSDFRIINRDKAVYTTTDAFVITGATGLLENDFHVFENLEIVSMRNSFRLLKRCIWSSWKDVHVYDCLSDGFYVFTDDNISALSFRQCRFGQNAGHGMYIRKDTGDPLAAWTFDTITIEKNNLCGLYVESTSSGIAGWSFRGLYTEENTITIPAANLNPRKANIDIRSSVCLGFQLEGSNLFGTPLATPVDWCIYVSSTTQSGFIGANRAGTFNLGFANLGANWFVAAQTGGTGTVTKAAGTVLLSELVIEEQGTDVLTLTGCTTSPQGTARMIKHRNLVTMYLPAIEGTSNTTAATLTGLSTLFRPARTQSIPIRVKDNGTIFLGLVQIDTGGVLNLFINAAGGAFTAAGTKGIQSTTITYSIE